MQIFRIVMGLVFNVAFILTVSPLKHIKTPPTSQQLLLLQNSLQDTSVPFVDILSYIYRLSIAKCPYFKF